MSKWIVACFVLHFLSIVCQKQFDFSETESIPIEQLIVSAISSIKSIRGSAITTTKKVVYRKMYGGFANNVMGLLSSYVIAIVLNLPLVCSIG